MAAELAGEWSGHPVLAGLRLVEQGLAVAASGTAWALRDRELTDAIVGLDAQIARTEALKASLLRENVSRETPDARGRQGARTVNLLKGRCRASAGRAGAEVANAKVTCPESGELRALGSAWAAGEVSSDHVGVARRTLARLPKKVLREHGEEIDVALTGHARAFGPGDTDTIAKHLLSVLAPERADRYDERAHERRHLGVSTDSTGMVLLRGQLDQAGGLRFTTVLDHLVETDRAAGGTSGSGEGSDGQVPDLRTRGQRRVDALVQMAVVTAENLGLATPLTTEPTEPTEPTESTEPTELTEPSKGAEPATRAEPVATAVASGVAGPGAPAPGEGEAGVTAGSTSERHGCTCARRTGSTPTRQRPVRAVPRVVVVTTPEQLAGAPGAGAAVTTDGTLVDRGTLTRLSCDAVIDRVVLGPTGRVLATDTLGRLATPAQQLALAARDQGCTWPGCATPPSLCEAHHLVWWSRGGPTTLDNLALLCHRHHTQIHAQPHDPHQPDGDSTDGWQMIVRDGVPWFRPPEHLDPTRALRRNTFHQTAAAARRAGLRWATSTPGDGRDATWPDDPDPP